MLPIIQSVNVLRIYFCSFTQAQKYFSNKSLQLTVHVHVYQHCAIRVCAFMLSDLHMYVYTINLEIFVVKTFDYDSIPRALKLQRNFIVITCTINAEIFAGINFCG